jgi:hypothetical protein
LRITSQGTHFTSLHSPPRHTCAGCCCSWRSSEKLPSSRKEENPQGTAASEEVYVIYYVGTTMSRQVLDLRSKI